MATAKAVRPPAAGPDDILTAGEAAAYLRVSESAVEGEAETGRLPGRRIGGEWRFLRRAVADWLSAGRGPAAPFGPWDAAAERDAEAEIAKLNDLKKSYGTVGDLRAKRQ